MAAIQVMQPVDELSRKRPYASLDLGQNQLRPQKARRIYYGIDINALLEQAQTEPVSAPAYTPAPRSSTLWTEKYRAKRFTDLLGDERTHRQVMHWLKKWERVICGAKVEDHKKILLLTGPAGLGKTTLAHVCARQAGYEVQEISASDERSREVVAGRIKDMVGSVNVRSVHKVAKPICVVVDEVDGAVGGEGGFVKAVIDLAVADQKSTTRKKFKLLRPIILICNDVYHPALRPLRQSSAAEIIHLRKPQLPALITRVQSIFQKEGISADTDGVRRLCEQILGASRTSQGEGDMRSVMVAGECVAAQLRATGGRLTRQYVDQANIQHGTRRGAAKEVVDRVFAIGGDLRQLLETHDADRIMTDVWTVYPSHPFQDDTIMSKPDAAYEWMHFHDSLSSAVFSSNEWELAPYLSTPILAFHTLFASQNRGAKDEPLTAWAASEAHKTHKATVQAMQNGLSLPLSRLYSPSDIATELLPYTLRMLNPYVNPVVIGGKGIAAVRKASEQQLVSRAANAMGAVGVRFAKVKVADDVNTSFIFRMEPALDELADFSTGTREKTRYAVRQVLEQEFVKEEVNRTEAARQARFERGGGLVHQLQPLAVPQKAVKIVRDFFGRPVKQSEQPQTVKAERSRIWVTYHEGFSNAVRKPLTLAELMAEL